MNASPQLRTTIGQLIFPTLPELNFGRLLADLDAALATHDLGQRRLSWERDNLALIDVGAARIILALTQDLDGAGAALVTVAVGFGPEAEGDTRLARRQAILARIIADRISARFAPAETIWSQSDEVAAPELVDRLDRGLAARRRSLFDVKAERAKTERATPRHFVEPTDLPRMLARLEAALASRRTGRADAILPFGTQDLPPLDLSGLPGGDALLDPQGAAARPTPTAPMRLAAHMIDATLMVVALPVGAAMMTYSLTRGADLHTSARAMAICGIGIGLLHDVGGLNGLGTLLAQAI